MERFDGYIFSKLHLIGSKSEGPSYFLQQWDYSEIPIIKNAELWKQDPKLHSFLGKKVTVSGKSCQDGIYYEDILDFIPFRKPETENKLEVDLKLGVDVLLVNKMPSTAPHMEQSMTLALQVMWPFRSIWRGLCPTSQVYDFFIERDEQIIWQWSKGQMFSQALTMVEIVGGRPYEYPVTWHFFPKDIDHEGTYVARAIFIASGQEASKVFEIKFARHCA